MIPVTGVLGRGSEARGKRRGGGDEKNELHKEWRRGNREPGKVKRYTLRDLFSLCQYEPIRRNKISGFQCFVLLIKIPNKAVNHQHKKKLSSFASVHSPHS